MRSIWAVARNTIAQGLRMKVALTVIVLLLVLLPLMSMIMVGDGTLKGKLQTFVSYGLSLTSMLLCLLTIIISTYTLSSDLKDKQIHLVVTKPIRRFQILCGKLLGVVLLDVFLLAIFSGVIYFLTTQIPALTGAAQAQRIVAEKEFFTARQSLTDPLDEQEIEKLAFEEYEKLKHNGRLPEKMITLKILSELRGREILRAQTVEVGTSKIWKFEDIGAREPNETFFVRYKYEVSTTPINSKIYGAWFIGDYSQQQYGPGSLQTPVYRVDRYDLIKMFHEFEVPADAITPEGFLELVFFNPAVNETTVIPEDVQVLLRAGSFTGNYVRVVLMILVRLVFLAALGVSVSTWLSFPVTILICIVVFFLGTINGFIMESFEALGLGAGAIYSITLKPILLLFPKFDGQFNPTQFMVSARLLGWMLLLKVFAVTILIRTVLLSLCGVLIFSRREIAKVSA